MIVHKNFTVIPILSIKVIKKRSSPAAIITVLTMM